MKKAEVFKKTYGENYEKIEFVKADLNDEKSMMEAVSGCQYIIHVASPVAGDPSIQKDELMIEWAVSGIKSILKACEANSVKKLVVTSSVATVSGSLWKGKGGVYDENDFSLEKPSTKGAYELSKCL